MNKLRFRKEPTANYSSFNIDGATVRIPLDKKKPITEVRYPEFYDVAINSKCAGGCSYCYTEATTKGVNFTGVVDRVKQYFGSMTPNQRPYQIAAGGAGEPTMHPEFYEICKAFHELDITFNYTTNGMTMTKKVIQATKDFCGGVAITCHPHLKSHWMKALDICIENQFRTNVHLIISDKDSIDQIAELKDKYGTGIEYYVLLPYMNVGFAANKPKIIDYAYLEQFLDKSKLTNVAFGANFYEFLCKTLKWDVSLYEPEILSKYLIMDEDMHLYKSSFNTGTPIHDYHRETYLLTY